MMLYLQKIHSKNDWDGQIGSFGTSPGPKINMKPGCFHIMMSMMIAIKSEEISERQKAKAGWETKME